MWNEPGTDSWRVTIKDVKIHGHRQLKEVTIWFYETDGYRFGMLGLGMDQAKAIFGKPGMDTLQVRPKV